MTALEDLPPRLAGLLTREEADRRLFRSPARLTGSWPSSPCRAGTAGTPARCPLAPTLGVYRVGDEASAGARAGARAAGSRHSGPPAGPQARRPACRRLPQTAIEHAGHASLPHPAHHEPPLPGASKNVRDDSRIVVADALRDQEPRARRRRRCRRSPRAGRPVRGRPRAAAAGAGLDPRRSPRLIAGEGHRGDVLHRSPIRPPQPPGQLCTASFLACLDCVNARALPHHLPCSSPRPAASPRCARTRSCAAAGSLSAAAGPAEGHPRRLYRRRTRSGPRRHRPPSASLADDVLAGALGPAMTALNATAADRPACALAADPAREAAWPAADVAWPSAHTLILGRRLLRHGADTATLPRSGDRMWPSASRCPPRRERRIAQPPMGALPGRAGASASAPRRDRPGPPCRAEQVQTGVELRTPLGQGLGGSSSFGSSRTAARSRAGRAGYCLHSAARPSRRPGTTGRHQVAFSGEYRRRWRGAGRRSRRGCG